MKSVVGWILVFVASAYLGISAGVLLGYLDLRKQGVPRRSAYNHVINVLRLQWITWLGRRLSRVGIAYSFQCGLCSRKFPCSNAWNHIIWCCKQSREEGV